MNENTKKRREWIKNAAIVFLVIMLILTFFSNTIMNYSLPEVATQTVTSGSITAKIRGTGNVEAGEPYNVSIKKPAPFPAWLSRRAMRCRKTIRCLCWRTVRARS